MILKLHSNYFRKFLDSADKPNVPATAIFKYNYTTVVDDDGIWAVEPKSTVSFRYFLGQPCVKYALLHDAGYWHSQKGLQQALPGQLPVTWPAILRELPFPPI
jgi:hypothetical protein